ncbi:hypothetical protein KFU94_38215 [Chloroflexi bacterium TSY]|nr:hypothetical protein [Chloroflexi bacterium TSY]
MSEKTTKRSIVPFEDKSANQTDIVTSLPVSQRIKTKASAPTTDDKTAHEQPPLLGKIGHASPNSNDQNAIDLHPEDQFDLHGDISEEEYRAYWAGYRKAREQMYRYRNSERIYIPVPVPFSGLYSSWRPIL